MVPSVPHALRHFSSAASIGIARRLRRSSRAMSQSPRIVGRYLVCDAFASGGMATVHLARLLGPNGFSRAVAIKQLHPQFANNPEFVSMLLEEAKLASRIRHANVVSPLDVVVTDAELLVVMDYVHGESVARLLRGAQRPPAPAVVSAVMTQTLLGLHAAHEATGLDGAALEMVHRDVSPQNILVGEDGVTRVVDFGIAKPRGWSHTTQSGVLKGKLGYMAPEQLRLESVDRRTDLFTAGVVLWEMLTGKRLFSADTLPLVVEQMANVEAELSADPHLEIPGELRQITLRALAGDPQRRYRTAWEMASAIAAVVPPATSLEVRAWVTELAGRALRERAERLALLEALRADEPLSAHFAATPAPVLQRAAPLSAGEITPSAVSVPREHRSRSGGRVALMLALGAMLAGGVLSAGKRLGTRASAQGASAASGSPVASPRVVGPAADAGRAEPPILAARHPVASAPPANLRELHAPLAPARAAAASSPRPRATLAPSNNCNVPFVIDGSGVKRFKPECF